MASIHHRATLPASLGIVGAQGILGCIVVDRQDRRVGTLRDIVLDLAAGRMAYAVIAVGDGPQDDPLVVPWNAVSTDPEIQRLRINADADWILRAPTVRRGCAPDRFAVEWSALIHNYFGTRPYWESAAKAQHS